MGWGFFTFLGMVCLLLTSANIYFNTPNPGSIKLNFNNLRFFKLYSPHLHSF